MGPPDRRQAGPKHRLSCGITPRQRKKPHHLPRPFLSRQLRGDRLVPHQHNTLHNRHRRRPINTHLGTCSLRIRGEAAKDGPHITGLSYSTEPTQTRTYDTGDIIKVAATFSEAVGVSDN